MIQLRAKRDTFLKKALEILTSNVDTWLGTNPSFGYYVVDINSLDRIIQSITDEVLDCRSTDILEMDEFPYKVERCKYSLNHDNGDNNHYYKLRQR